MLVPVRLRPRPCSCERDRNYATDCVRVRRSEIRTVAAAADAASFSVKAILLGIDQRHCF